MEVELTGESGIRTGEATADDGRFFVSVRIDDGDLSASIILKPWTALQVSRRLVQSALKGLLFKK
jgi:hypothetical protein